MLANILFILFLVSIWEHNILLIVLTAIGTYFATNKSGKLQKELKTDIQNG